MKRDNANIDTSSKQSASKFGTSEPQVKFTPTNQRFSGAQDGRLPANAPNQSAK